MKEAVAMVSTFEEWETVEQERGIKRIIVGDMESIAYDQLQLEGKHFSAVIHPS